jgi:hypothetical protein
VLGGSASLKASSTFHSACGTAVLPSTHTAEASVAISESGRAQRNAVSARYPPSSRLVTARTSQRLRHPGCETPLRKGVGVVGQCALLKPHGAPHPKPARSNLRIGASLLKPLCNP